MDEGGSGFIMGVIFTDNIYCYDFQSPHMHLWVSGINDYD